MTARTMFTSPILLLLGLLPGCRPDACTWSWHDGVPIGDRCVPCPEGTTLQSSIVDMSITDLDPDREEAWCSTAEGVAHGPEAEWSISLLGELSPVRSGMNHEGTPIGVWSFSTTWGTGSKLDPQMFFSTPMREGRPEGIFSWTGEGEIASGQYIAGHRHERWLLQQVATTTTICYDGRAGMTLRPMSTVTPDAPLPDCPATNPVDGPFRLVAADGSVEAEGAYLRGLPEGLWRGRATAGGLLPVDEGWASGNFVNGRADGPWTWTSDAGEVLATGTLDEGQPRGVWTTKIPQGIRRITWSDDGKLRLVEYVDGEGRMYGRACATGSRVLWSQGVDGDARPWPSVPAPLPAPPFACAGTPTVDKPQSNLPSRPHAP